MLTLEKEMLRGTEQIPSCFQKGDYPGGLFDSFFMVQRPQTDPVLSDYKEVGFCWLENASFRETRLCCLKNGTSYLLR